jgi:hypothetical protein
LHFLAPQCDANSILLRLSFDLSLHTTEELKAAQQHSREQLVALQHALEEAQQAAAAASAEADTVKVTIPSTPSQSYTVSCKFFV